MFLATNTAGMPTGSAGWQNTWGPDPAYRPIHVHSRLDTGMHTDSAELQNTWAPDPAYQPINAL